MLLAIQEREGMQEQSTQIEGVKNLRYFFWRNG